MATLGTISSIQLGYKIGIRTSLIIQGSAVIPSSEVFVDGENRITVGMSGNDLIVYHTASGQVIGRWTGQAIPAFKHIGGDSTSTKTNPYRVFQSGEFKVYANTNGAFRFINFFGTLYLQRTLTATGFAGIAGLDYRNTSSWKATGGLGVFRIGNRGNTLVYDETLTPLGFAGEEGTDYKLISNE